MADVALFWALHLIVRYRTFYPEAQPVCPVQFRCAPGQLYVSVVIDTNVILGMQC